LRPKRKKVGILPKTALFLAVLTAFTVPARPQEVVDKTVAVVGDGLRSELITYSDLLWQLALQPNTPLDPPRSEDLNQALQLLIEQRLFALEAQRLPNVAPTEAEIDKKINDILSYFPSPGAFEARLQAVGFDSVRDPAFIHIIAQRVAIDKYVDFRFGSFVVITPEDEARYYREVFVPNFRSRNPGRIMPTLDEQRAEINRVLTNQKITTSMETFLEEAKRRTQVEILSEV
jgi:hypothetical protein